MTSREVLQAVEAWGAALRANKVAFGAYVDAVMAHDDEGARTLDDERNRLNVVADEARARLVRLLLWGPT